MGQRGGGYRIQKNSPSLKMSNGFILPEGKVTPNTLFVGGIDMQADERDLHDVFKKFGLIKEVKLITYKGGVCKGYGFVYFDEDVNIPFIIEQQATFGGRKLKLGPAIMKEKTFRSMQSRQFRPWMSPPQYLYCSCCCPMGGGVAPASPTGQPYSYSSLPAVMIPQMPMSYVPSYAQNAYNLQYASPQWPGEQRPRLINQQNYADSGVQTVLTLL